MVSQNKMQSILGKAQKMMLDENFNRQVEMAASLQRPQSMNGGGGNDLSALEAQAFGYSMPSTLTEQQKNEIRMRMETTPQVPQLSTVSESIANSLALNTHQYQQPVQYGNSGGGIDYSLISKLIDESISRHLSEMKKTVLNESSGAGNNFIGMKFCDGNKVQFVDAKGNLFEGVFKLKKKSMR